MSNEIYLTTQVDPPTQLALVLICEKCGRRVADSKKKNPSHHLVSKIKRLAKREFERGEIRAVLTSCLDLCPDDRVAVAIVPTQPRTSTHFLEADVSDVEAASVAIVKGIRRLATPRPGRD